MTSHSLVSGGPKPTLRTKISIKDSSTCPVLLSMDYDFSSSEDTTEFDDAVDESENFTSSDDDSNKEDGSSGPVKNKRMDDDLSISELKYKKQRVSKPNLKEENIKLKATDLKVHTVGRKICDKNVKAKGKASSCNLVKDVKMESSTQKIQEGEESHNRDVLSPTSFERNDLVHTYNHFPPMQHPFYNHIQQQQMLNLTYP
ncbi:uncharacterized protein LOC114915197 [Cajanus cajan]|uniref:uncharacterized protein LOC114915197 n=1 Tax=Cajanus cajan TaxID=3821 RepID=UPI0010FB631E|nr:uncharacterized protein LOC114915197 [Cajanus cajan]